MNLVSVYGNYQWDKIGAHMKKDQMECQDFYGFLMNCANRLLKDKRDYDYSESEDEESPMTRSIEILENKPVRDRKKKRHRRKAAQIERGYKCQEKHCNRSYGTEGALKMHIKIKHPNIQYDSKYSKGRLINQKKMDPEDLDEFKQSKMENDIDLIESTSYLIVPKPTNIPQSIDTSHQTMIVTPSPISYNNYIQRKETQQPPMQFQEKMMPKVSITRNVMSLNNLIS